MAQNNDGPGKRLKRDEVKKTLYVNNPNDPRLLAYQDSLSTFNNFYKVRDMISKIKDNQFSSIKETDNYVDNLDKIYPKNEALLSEGPKEKIKTIRRLKYPEGNVTWRAVLQATEPKRPVVLMPEPIQPRQATLTPSEIVPPVMRPASVPEPTSMEEPMEAVIEEKPLVRKLPKAVMPRRQGGWGNQSVFMRAFPNLFAK